MIKIDVQIYGVHDRDEMIANTVNKLGLGDECVHYDDRPGGGMMMYTAKKAWLAPLRDGQTHRVALADDVLVCEDFWNICEQIANAHPTKIISLFPYEYMHRVPQIEGHPTPYVRANILSGCAIMMPVEYIKPCFEYVKAVFDDNCADDEGIQAWADHNNIPIITTIPSLVQHIGDISIANKGCQIRRTVYYEERPTANWGCEKVLRYVQKEWFFSNHGKKREREGIVTYVS